MLSGHCTSWRSLRYLKKTPTFSNFHILKLAHCNVVLCVRCAPHKALQQFFSCHADEGGISEKLHVLEIFQLNQMLANIISAVPTFVGKALEQFFSCHAATGDISNCIIVFLFPLFALMQKVDPRYCYAHRDLRQKNQGQTNASGRLSWPTHK